MNLSMNGIQVSVADTEIAHIVRQHLLNGDAISKGIPRLGAAWRGGVFAGITRGQDGRDILLIAGPEITACTWAEAKAKVAEIKVDCFSDFRLPFRREQSLQFSTVPELFKPEWYWSCEEAPSPGYAFVQGFDDGNQTSSLKGNRCRARAVRSEVLE